MSTEIRLDRRRLGALTAALVLLLSACVTARAEGADGPDFITMIMAEDTVRQYDLRDAEGNPLTPRAAPEMKGRGNPDVPGQEPDYRGVVGYMVLQSSWDMSRFSTFASSPWVLPVYEQNGRRWKVVGDIQHKTPVLVTDQRIKEGMGHKYTGYLHIVRLDSGEQGWIDVTQFVTVPYWTMSLEKAVNYGYCIAVYSNKSGVDPVDGREPGENWRRTPGCLCATRCSASGTSARTRRTTPCWASSSAPGRRKEAISGPSCSSTGKT